MDNEEPESPDPSAPEATPAATRMMSGLGVVASLVFVFAWLGPITYVGSAGKDIKWMHRDLRHMQRVACLFTKEVGAWGTYHIEVRPSAGKDWVELPLDGYFDMSIFGYRTRFHRLLGKSYRRRGGRARAEYMARWIADRHHQLDPDAPKLGGVRFVSASRRVETLLKEKGRFRKQALADVPKRRRRVLMTFDGEELRYVPRMRSRKGRKLNRPPRRPVRSERGR